MLSISERGTRLIKAWEGCLLQAYDDATELAVEPGGVCRGTITIGIGHTSVAGPPRVEPGMVISVQEALDILANDLGPVEEEVALAVHADLSQQQTDALVSFQYNTGWLTHPHCTLTEVINRGDPEKVIEADFGLYDRASGRVIRGLVKRRHAEALVFGKGIYTGPDGEVIT